MIPVGVIGGVACVRLTGWLWLDPAVALVVAANIVLTGHRLLHRSANGLMDASLPDETLKQRREWLSGYREHRIQHHALQTREAGGRAFTSCTC